MVNFARSKTFQPINSAVWVVIGLLIIQQLIVASSTIWITRLIAHIQEGKFVISFLLLYLVSLLLPYLPGAAAIIEMTKAKVRANVEFVQQFTNSYYGKIVEWSNNSHHTTKTSVLTGEAPQTINAYLDYIYDLYSTSLNVLLNLLILAFIIEPLLLLSYVIGVTIAFFILRLQKSRKRVLALRAQQSRIKWFSMLLKTWDNVLLGNRYNFTTWQGKENQRASRYANSNLKLTTFSQTVSIGMAFALLGPTFILICYLAMTNAQNLTWLAILVVALPRLFQVLSYSYEMLFILADVPMQKSRLQTITKLLDVSGISDMEKSKESLQSRIQWDKIKIVSPNQEVQSAQDLITSMPGKGRYTLKGENGSGKTSLLLLLKGFQGENAYYLPAKHNLLFAGRDHGFSTGQWARKTLQELIDQDVATIFLFDEWDANLDSSNKEMLSDLIDQLAINCTVIESRHRT